MFSVMVTILENEIKGPSSNPRQGCLVFHFMLMPLRKTWINLSSPTIGKELGKLGSFALIRQPVWKKENPELKLVVLHLKIDLMSYPAGGRGVG